MDPKLESLFAEIASKIGESRKYDECVSLVHETMSDLSAEMSEMEWRAYRLRVVTEILEGFLRED